MAIQWSFTSSFFMSFHDHFCPLCNALMEKVRCSTKIDSKSEMAKLFKLDREEVRGNIKYFWYELRCPSCGMQVSDTEMKKCESRKRQEGIFIPRHIAKVNPFYIHFKKHHCPKCGIRLQIDYEDLYTEHQLPSEGSDRLSLSNIRFTGSAQVRRRFFHCPGCGYEISFSDMAEYECSEAHTT